MKFQEYVPAWTLPVVILTLLVYLLFLAKLSKGRSSTETGQKPYLVMATLRMAGTETMPALPDSNFGTKLGGRPEVAKSAISALMAAVEVLAATDIVLEQVERPAGQQMADNLESCKGIIAGRAVKSSHAVLLAILTETESLGCRRHWLRRLGVGLCACGVCSPRTAT